MYESAWKCGELKLYFLHPQEDLKQNSVLPCASVAGGAAAHEAEPLYSYTICLPFLGTFSGAVRAVPELAVDMQACFDRGDLGGAGQAQKRLDVWAKKRGVSGK